MNIDYHVAALYHIPTVTGIETNLKDIGKGKGHR